ncbi:MAG: PDZ domain-containing protein [Thermoanaerobaculia bacterium]
MKISALKAALLSIVLVLPSASRLKANGDPTPAPREKKVVIAAPDEEVIVDGDNLFVWNGDEDPEILADLEDLDGDSPHTIRFRGRSSGYIGVNPIRMTPELRQHFGAPKEAGVLVATVEKDGPAAKAGLKVGDIVTAVDGSKVDSVRDLVRSVRRKKDGETIHVDVIRDRAARTLTVTVASRKDDEMRLGELPGRMRRFRFDHMVPPVPPVPPAAPLPTDFDLQNRLDKLEQRLKELESRVPAR